MLGHIARHYRERVPYNPVCYHEIYNEPDNEHFFIGTLNDYLAMYRAGATAIRDADPHALIGGPALAWEDTWIEPFLDFVRRHRLPLDFFSFHFYGVKQYTRHELPTLLRIVREHFSAHPEFATTELHLNEFNSYPIDYPQGGLQDKYVLAAALLRDFKYFLAQPHITLVHWAQFMDSGQGNFSGMIDIDGYRKAVFNAYKLYTMLPIDRCVVTIDGADDVDALAGRGDHLVGLLLWNETSSQRSVNVALKDIPLERGTLRVYRIDAEHASWGDAPNIEHLRPVEVYQNVDKSHCGWTGELPADGVVYLEVVDDTYTEPAGVPVGDVLRVLHFYPDRTTSAYADFDTATWTVRLGMAQETTADVLIGATAEQLPPVLAMSFTTEGEIQYLNADSTLAFRIDYQTGSAYTASVLWHGPCGRAPDLYSNGRTEIIAWGTQRAPDHVVRVADLSQFRVDLAALAPPQWTGRVQMTVLMQNTGRGTRAKVTVRRAT